MTLNLNMPILQEATLSAAVREARRLTGADFSSSLAIMDLINCHNNGCELNLDRLARGFGEDPLHAYDVVSDIWGIGHRIDRTTGRLPEGWKPIFAKEGGIKVR